ncbi:hypothetical protein [Nonomuraea sp. NPDC049784]|uniref:hypothetical protein n=1 Tax=Nonomuraea sp. NPDC049784 TaxID=3154361 RepID=UPI0034102F6C
MNVDGFFRITQLAVERMLEQGGGHPRYPQQRCRPGHHQDPHAPEETHEALAGLHPVGRIGEISDVVDAVVYLENAPFVTGAILPVDGGQSPGH